MDIYCYPTIWGKYLRWINFLGQWLRPRRLSYVSRITWFLASPFTKVRCIVSLLWPASGTASLRAGSSFDRQKVTSNSQGQRATAAGMSAPWLQGYPSRELMVLYPWHRWVWMNKLLEIFPTNHSCFSPGLRSSLLDSIWTLSSKLRRPSSRREMFRASGSWRCHYKYEHWLLLKTC